MFDKKSPVRKPFLFCAALAIVMLGLGVPGSTNAPHNEAYAQGAASEQEEALRLAFQAQAELRSHDDEGLIRSVLLATESLRRAPTAEAAEVLQAGLLLLPRRVYQWPAEFRPELASSDDRWLVLRLDARRELWELPAMGNTLTEPRQVGHLPLDDDTQSMVFGPGEKWLVTWTADQLQIWGVDDGKLAGTWTPNSTPVYSVELSTDKQRLFLIGETGIQVLDASHMPRLRELASIPRESTSRSYAISPDGQWVAVVSEDGTQSNVWQAGTGQLAQVIALPQGPTDLLFHPSGTHLVGNDETAVRIWDVESGAEVATAETLSDWPGVAFSSTGKWLITPGAGHEDVDVFPFPPQSAPLTAAESVLRTWNGDSSGLALKFSPDDRWLRRYEGCTQKRCSPMRDVTVWDMERSNPDDRELNMTLAGRIDHASFSPDSGWLHTVHTSGEHISQVWRLPDGEEVVRLPGTWSQLSPGGRWLLGYSGEDGPLQLWTAEPGRHWNAMRHGSTYFTGHGAGALAFSPDGRWLATGGVDNVVRVWDAASGAQNAVLEHDDVYYLDLQAGISTLAFSPEGQMLASLSDSGDLRLWDMSIVVSPTMTGVRPVAQFRTPPWSSLTFSPDSQWLLADHGAWNIATEKEKYGPELYGGYALSLDGQVIASRQDDVIILRDFASEETIHQFEHKGGLGNLLFGPDGLWLVSVGWETVAIWDTTSGKLTHQIDINGQLRGYAVSPDGRQIAVGSTGSPPVVWDIESGKAISRFAPTAIAAVPRAFSPDGDFLVVRDPQRRIRVFDIATGTQISSLPREIQFNRAAFSPDSKQLATTDTQGNVRFWFWQPEDLVAEVCQHLPRNLTAQEWQQYFGDEPYRPTCDDLPAATTLSIVAFTVDAEDIGAGKQLNFRWETTHATRAEIWSGASQRRPQKWDVAPSGTLTVELTETFYADPPMTLIAYDDKGEQVRQSIKIGWPCRYEYFFSPPPEACPLHEAVFAAAAEQTFEQGRMIWLERIYGQENLILVLHDDGQLDRFDDTWTPGEPESDPAVVPPEGLYQPVRGFGKVWRENETIRGQLGWALVPEKEFEGAWQEQLRESIPSMAYLRSLDGENIKVWDWNTRWGGSWSEVKR